MTKVKWVVFVVALGMMAATAAWLKELRGMHLLGPPGVKIARIPVYSESGGLVSQESVALPASVLGVSSEALPITGGELDVLPRDTTFGRRRYQLDTNDPGIQINVVLMGSDHTSIHQPQYCLYAQDWNVLKTEAVRLPMEHPFADIPALKLTASHKWGPGKTISCIYVYWFVSGDKITADEGSRLWSIWKTMLRKGEMERWAYISYFATCVPGHEEATFERLEKFIRASVPEFQLVTGQSAGPMPSMTAQK